jgi:hypothetical protein
MEELLNSPHHYSTLIQRKFLIGSDKVLGGAHAGMVIVVGGPGSGKGILCG